MIRNFLILIIYLSLFTRISYCQNYERPKINKISQPKQEYGKPIIYQFPEKVNEIIEDYIQTMQDTISFFNIEIDAENNGYRIILRQTNNTVIQDTTSFQSSILSSSNRYCKIANRNIPIYLSSDKEFGFYNFVITGDELVIILERKGYRIFEIVEYHKNR